MADPGLLDDPDTVLTAVSVLDPAIDRELSAVDEYGLTRDRRLVVALPGATLREFRLRPIRPEEMAAVASAPGDAGAILAFRFACVEVANAYGPGQPLRPTRLQRRADRPGEDERTWDARDLQAVMSLFGWAVFAEMSQIVVDRAMQGKAFGGSVNYTLPPLCTAVLRRLEDRLAAQDRETDRQAPIERSASDRTPSGETPSAPSSDRGTGAPATAPTEPRDGAPPPSPTSS